MVRIKEGGLQLGLSRFRLRSQEGGLQLGLSRFMVRVFVCFVCRRLCVVVPVSWFLCCRSLSVVVRVSSVVFCPVGVVVGVSPFVPRTWRFWLKAKEVSQLGLREVQSLG